MPPIVRKRSDIWIHFESVDKSTTKCKICSILLKTYGSTSSMVRHFKTKHSKEPFGMLGMIPTIPTTGNLVPGSDSTSTDSAMDARVSEQSTSIGQHIDVSSFLLQPMSITQSNEIDQQVLRFLVKDCHHPSILEEAEFVALISVMCPGYELPSRRRMVDSLFPVVYRKIKEELRLDLQEARAVCVTTDGWKNYNNESFLAVTCHWLNANLELRSALLDCKSFDERHTATLSAIFSEWAIDDRVACVVTDNSANVAGAVKEGGWHHLECFAHTLNLIGQAATQKISHVVTKVKAIVRFFIKSLTALRHFKREDKGKTALKLIQDCPTRWNSTYTMLERFLENKDSIMTTLVSLYGCDVPDPLTKSDWEVIQQSLRSLKILHNVTVEISGEKTVPLSKVIPLANILRKDMQKELEASTRPEVKDQVREMVQLLNSELNQRYKDYEENEILGQATLLDPRFKNFGFGSSAKAESAVEILKKEVEIMSPAPTVEIKEEEPSEISVENDIWAEYREHVAKSRERNSTTKAVIEVNAFLEEPIIRIDEDPLAWWRERRAVYPTIVKIMERRLCSTATSVPCENIFSKAGQVLADKRSRLGSKMASQILFLQHNL